MPRVSALGSAAVLSASSSSSSFWFISVYLSHPACNFELPFRRGAQAGEQGELGRASSRLPPPARAVPAERPATT